MRLYITKIILLFSIVSCENNQTTDIATQTGFHSSNQTQFTFLVFDNSLVDSFFNVYKPLLHSNIKIRQAINELLLNQDFKSNKKLEEKTFVFAKNTEPLDTNSFNLALNVLKATLDSGGEKYFSGSLHYLFFHECLPEKFKYKWSQSMLGHFEFNRTFFDLLRGKSKELDNLIYGEDGFWSEDIKPFFSEYIYNEITLEKAKKIKNTITTDVVFNDRRFTQDKTNFLEFLNKTISGEWRLILIDWD